MAKHRTHEDNAARPQSFTDWRTTPPELPFFLLRQNYDNGETTGFWQHLDFYALYIVRGGRGLHIIDGHPYAIARGDVYITAPGATHAYQQYQDLQADALCFQIDLFSALQLEALRALPGFARLFVDGDAEQTRGEHFHLAPQSLERAEELLSELTAELPPGIEIWPNDDAVSRAIVPVLVFRLLVWLARERQNSLRGENEIATKNSSLAEILRYCEAHFAEDISVPQLAARLFVTPSHFGELFRRATGTSPAAYVRRLRLEHAQKLLRSTNQNLEIIARESGLGNGAQLSRAFRAAFSQTPSQYRAAYGKKA